MKSFNVVPYIGTWIETTAPVDEFVTVNVVPYIGTWIETGTIRLVVPLHKSYLI